MRRSTLVSTILTLLLALPAAAFAAPVAEMEVSPNMVTWRPSGEHAQLSLVVAGPDGQRLERTVDGTGTVALSTIEKVPGFKWTDGTYHYELRTVAAPRQRGVDKAAEGQVQSGSFTILDGALVIPREEPSLKDQVIPDDLIVQGSICVGFDCVNNENFGFDTIRLKENNTRIKFEDTSTGTFPSNDWQLTANDSASGGTNKFSIEDITGARVPLTIVAGATTNSIFVSSTGRVGFRTSTPVLDLHVATSNTPGLRLEQNNTGGFSAQTWDVAGNEANFFIRDVTSGSLLPFRLRPGAPTSSLDIASDGDVGLGTSGPTASLHVRRTDGTAKVFVEEASGTAATRTLLEMTNNGNVQMQFANGTTTWNFLNNNDFTVTDVGDAITEFRLTPAGALFIAGSITTGGPTCGAGCDRVFSEDFPLESIEEHAAQMWANSFLPAVGPTPEDGAPFNITEKTGGMLNELEKAHIYIAQLNDVVKTKQGKISELEERLARLEAVIAAQSAD